MRLTLGDLPALNGMALEATLAQARRSLRRT